MQGWWGRRMVKRRVWRGGEVSGAEVVEGGVEPKEDRAALRALLSSTGRPLAVLHTASHHCRPSSRPPPACLYSVLLPPARNFDAAAPPL